MTDGELGCGPSDTGMDAGGERLPARRASLRRGGAPLPRPAGCVDDARRRQSLRRPGGSARGSGGGRRPRRHGRLLRGLRGLRGPARRRRRARAAQPARAHSSISSAMPFCSARWWSHSAASPWRSRASGTATRCSRSCSWWTWSRCCSARLRRSPGPPEACAWWAGRSSRAAARAAIGDGLTSAAAAGQVTSLVSITALLWAATGWLVAVAARLDRDQHELHPREISRRRWVLIRVVLPLAAVLALPATAGVVSLEPPARGVGGVLLHGAFFIFAHRLLVRAAGLSAAREPAGGHARAQPAGGGDAPQRGARGALRGSPRR